MTRCRRRTKEQRLLLKAILHLPTDLRDVFLLHRMADSSYEEIAARLGFAPDVVEAHFAEAMFLIASSRDEVPADIPI